MSARGLALLLLLQLASPAAAQPRVDSLGDPLPPGAIARLGTLRMRHADTGGITSAVYSPDATTVFSAGEGSAVVRAWDVATGSERRQFALPAGEAPFSITLATSADGKLLAAANKARVHLWDAATGKPAGTCDGPGRVIAVALRDGGKTLVGATDAGAVVWWDVASGQETARWLPLDSEAKTINGVKHAPGFAQARFSADGQWLAVQRVFALEQPPPFANRYGFQVIPPTPPAKIAVFDLADRKERWRLTWAPSPEAPSPLFAFAPRGSRLAVRVSQDVIEVRDAATGTQLAGHRVYQPSGWPAMVSCLTFTGDGGSVAYVGWDAQGQHNEVRLWSLDDTTRVRALPVRGPVRYARHLVFAPDNRTVLTVFDNRLYLADATTGAPLWPRDGHCTMVSWVAFSPGGRSLRSFEFSGGVGGGLTWDTTTWKETAADRDYTPPPPGYVALSPDKSIGVATTGDRWDMVTFPARKPLATLQPPAPGMVLRFGAFSEHGTLFYAGAYPPGKSGTDLTMAFYEAGTGKLRLHYAYTNNDYGWAFAPDDRLLARCLSDATIEVFDMATGKLLRTVGNRRLPAPRPGNGYQADFAPGRPLLAQWDAGHASLTMWNLATGKELWSLPQARGQPWIRVAWSPDGRTLAVTGTDGENGIQIVEAETGKVRHTFRGHTSGVKCLGWSPDGRLVASGSHDTTVLVWDVYGRVP
jgi:WD40 repeat protein